MMNVTKLKSRAELEAEIEALQQYKQAAGMLAIERAEYRGEAERLRKAAQSVVDAFEKMGRTDSPVEWLRRRTDCENTLLNLKAALNHDEFSSPIMTLERKP